MKTGAITIILSRVCPSGLSVSVRFFFLNTFVLGSVLYLQKNIHWRLLHGDENYHDRVVLYLQQKI
jgi:hypothetical protein